MSFSRTHSYTHAYMLTHTPSYIGKRAPEPSHAGEGSQEAIFHSSGQDRGDGATTGRLGGTRSRPCGHIVTLQHILCSSLCSILM